MKRKLLVFLAVALPLALFFAAREAASWRPQLIGKTKGIDRVQISPDGRWAALSGYGSTEIWDLQTHRPGIKPFGFQCFSTDSKSVVVLSSRQQPPDFWFHTPQVQLLNLESGKLEKSWRDARNYPNDWPLQARFSLDGKRLVVVTKKTSRQFDVPSGRVLSRANFRRDLAGSHVPKFRRMESCFWNGSMTR